MHRARLRVNVSFGLAVMLGLAWGPFAAVAELLRYASPDAFFSPSRYLCLTTAVSAALAFSVAVIGLLASRLTIRSWNRNSSNSQRLWALAGLLAWGILVLYQADSLPIPQYLVPAQNFLITTLLTSAIVWCVVSALFDFPQVQLTFLPLICLPSLLQLIDVSHPLTITVTGLGILWVAHRYTDNWRPLFADIPGMVLFVAIPLVLFVHIYAGSFVPQLDIPYTLSLAGIFGIAIAILIATRNQAVGRSIIWPAIAVLLFSALIAGGGVWSQHPPSPPTDAVKSPNRPNITLIVWDSARACDMRLYGGRHDLTPTFDSIASRGVLFDRAIATSCWTLPTHASMFTGLWPRTHAASYGGYSKLTDKYRTIAERLSKAGYQTLGLSANHVYAGSRAGIDQGFQSFYEPGLSAECEAKAMQLLRSIVFPYDERALDIRRGLRRWLFSRTDSDRPLFVFVNLFETHRDFAPPPDMLQLPANTSRRSAHALALTPLPELFLEGPNGPDPSRRRSGWKTFEALYRAEIRYSDAVTNDLCNKLGADAQGTSNTLTIVTSDHGEDLGHRAMASHMFTPFETSLHVPLVMSWPSKLVGGKTVADTISMRNIFATVADAAGLRETTWRQVGCESLLPLATGARQQPQNQQPVFAEVWSTPLVMKDMVEQYLYGTPFGRFTGSRFVVYEDQYKYIRAFGQHEQALFNIARDPQEAHDISEQKPEVCSKMLRLINEWLRKTPNNMPTFMNGYEIQPLETEKDGP